LHAGRPARRHRSVVAGLGQRHAPRARAGARHARVRRDPGRRQRLHAWSGAPRRVPMIAVHHATPETFDALVLEPAGELVVLYFWGPDCPNCEFFASRLPAVLEQLGDVRARLVKVNAYEHDALATRFALYGIPQFY